MGDVRSTEEKVSRALDDYLGRKYGKTTSDTCAPWLMDSLKEEGVRLLDMENLELQDAKVLCRELLNFISERQGAVFVISAKDEKPAGSTPSDIDHTKLIPKEEARKKFEPESRSQLIVDEIYRGGTRADIVQRLWSYDTYKGEITFLPGYLDNVLSKIQRVDS